MKILILISGIFFAACSIGQSQESRIDTLFKAQDTNNDGRISADEARLLFKRNFSRMDRNGDRFIDRDEVGRPAARRPVAASTNLPEPDYADVKYGEHERCVMDIWLAKSEAKTPVVISVHGGGFVAGDKKMASRSVNEFLEKGITFVSINYPFKNQVPWPEVFPQALRSIQFLRYHSERYHIDKNKFAMVGGSAGGGMTLWALFHDDLADPDSTDPVARESSKPQCGVALSSQATYDQLIWHEILGVDESAVTALKSREEMAGWLGIEVDELTTAKGIELRKRIDMLQMIDKDDSPVMLVNPRPNELPGDIIHHPIHSIAVKEKCDAVGLECKLILAVTPPGERIRNVDFILQHLK
ncbi:MAG: alpha/beta hydrolase [Verrucomicrobiales bacterium]|nr:alpha/beta hydrolase [Verrucomicrobiales bacterium]